MSLLLTSVKRTWSKEYDYKLCPHHCVILYCIPRSLADFPWVVRAHATRVRYFDGHWRLKSISVCNAIQNQRGIYKQNCELSLINHLLCMTVSHTGRSLRNQVWYYQISTKINSNYPTLRFRSKILDDPKETPTKGKKRCLEMRRPACGHHHHHHHHHHHYCHYCYIFVLLFFFRILSFYLYTLTIGQIVFWEGYGSFKRWNNNNNNNNNNNKNTNNTSNNKNRKKNKAQQPPPPPPPTATRSFQPPPPPPKLSLDFSLSAPICKVTGNKIVILSRSTEWSLSLLSLY